MVQLHSELRTEAEGVEGFPPRRGAGEGYVVGLSFSPHFLGFENTGRGESYWGSYGVWFGEGSGDRGDDPY